MSQEHKTNEEAKRQQSIVELRRSTGGDQKVIKEIKCRVEADSPTCCSGEDSFSIEPSKQEKA